MFSAEEEKKSQIGEARHAPHPSDAANSADLLDGAPDPSAPDALPDAVASDSGAASDSGRAAGADRELDPNHSGRDIGVALRRVYQEAASEQIPDDLLDLLSKLD